MQESTGMKIGYIRISKGDQTTALQEDALAKAGVTKIFCDVMSGGRDDRPQFQAMLDYVRPGDIILVWRLDRLGRSLKTLIETIQRLQTHGVHFHCLMENIDTSTIGGMLVFHIFGALAEWERGIIRERTKAGLEAARARGRKGGRPPAQIDPKKIQRAREMYDERRMSVEEIMKATDFKSRPTFYKYVVHGGKPSQDAR